MPESVEAGSAVVVESTGVVVGAGKLSLPNLAKGFGLPSLPSGTRTMLESLRFKKAESDSRASFNFIFLTFKSKERKSLAIAALSSEKSKLFMEFDETGIVSSVEETTRFPSSEEDLTKKT